MTARLKGTVTEVVNHGTIIELVCSSSDGSQPGEFRVPFDHRMFQHFAEDVKAKGKRLVGLEVEVNDKGTVFFREEV